MDAKQRCMNCMQDMRGFEVCLHCGWIEGSAPRELSHLVPRTLLAERYMIGNSIGFGGFGITYRAWDTKLDVQVAVKEFFPSGLVSRSPETEDVIIYSGDRRTQYEAALGRFLAEARNMAKFSNQPHIVNVIDYFEANRTAYIVMEYLDGQTLKSTLAASGDKLPVDVAISLILPVCDALNVIHKEGIIHRDISPDNIFITSDKRVKLIDFGAARLAQGEKEETLSVILKPGYAPPEQYRSKSRQGPYTDIYALGATLYRMVTGVVPEESVDRLVKDELVRPSEANVVVPEPISRAILRAMALNSSVRFQDVAAFRKALTGKFLVATPEDELARRRKRRLLVSVAAAVLLTAGVTALVLLQTVFRPVERIDSEAIQPDQLTIWLPDNEADQQFAYLYAARERFTSDYPDLSLDIKRMPQADYTDRLVQAGAAKTMPNVFSLEQPSAQTDALAADLELLLQSAELDDFLFLNEYERWFAGKHVLPLGFSVPLLYVNQYVLNEQQIQLPESRVPAEQIYAALSGLVNLDRLIVSPLQLTSIALQNNEQVRRAKQDPFTAAYAQTAADNLDQLAQVYLQDERIDSAFTRFAEEQVAAYLGDASEFDAVQEALPGYYGVLPAPGDQTYCARFTDFWSVSRAGTDNQQQASMLFLINLLGDETQDEMHVQQDRSLPLNRRVFTQYISVKRPELAFLDAYLTRMTFFGEAQMALDVLNQQIHDQVLLDPAYNKDVLIDFITAEVP